MAGKCGCTTWVPPLLEGGHEEAWGSRCISPAFLAGYRPCPEPVLGGSGICSLRATWDDGRLHCVPRCGNGVSASFVKSGLRGAMAAAPAGDMGEPCNCSGCYTAGLGKRALYPSYNFSVKVLENAFFPPFFFFSFFLLGFLSSKIIIMTALCRLDFAYSLCWANKPRCGVLMQWAERNRVCWKAM